MKRTNSPKLFLKKNRRLLLFLLLPLAGCITGMIGYEPLQSVFGDWLSLLTVGKVSGTFGDVFSAWLSVCFQPFCLWAILFIGGLSVCGAPTAFLIPLFWGMGTGLQQAHYAQFGADGWLVLVVILLPAAAMKMVLILMASSESLQLSVLLASQLLPRSSRCGGLWQVFRLYCIRFFVLLIPIALAGAWEVVLRLLLGGLLI